MAILAIFTGNGLGKENYEAVRREIDWEQNQPAGAIVHVASFDNAGNVHVADVWSSQAELDAFVSSRLMPAMQKLKVNPPEVEVYPVHNINVYAAADKHKI